MLVVSLLGSQIINQKLKLNNGLHYYDVIMGSMGPKSPASRLFTQPLIQA